MHCINVHNVNQGLAEGLRMLRWQGREQSSRNGPVLVMPQPVMTTYADPCARVLFSAARDANPFFHFMEALWMLAGRNDLEWPKTFNSKFGEYSDDGHTIHGAYGHRWRQHFKFDQLPLIADELRQDPLSRRAVLSMWDAPADFNNLDGRDVPCNTHAYFDVRDGALNMTVCCRSNDIWWGCYGANAVHFSMLLEYMAAAVGVPVGVYRQLSNNFHIYTDIVPAETMEDQLEAARDEDLYTEKHFPTQRHGQRRAALGPTRVPMVDGEGTGAFMQNLEFFMEQPWAYVPGGAQFFSGVARPMYRAWSCFKDGAHADSFAHAANIEAGDWNIACTQWLERRAQRRQELNTMVIEKES